MDMKLLKDTLFIKYFGMTKVPMIFYIGPSVIENNDNKCIIKVPLNRRTKNHLNSMYFGVLAAGADLAAGFVAMQEIHQSKKNVSLSFKDFHADFFKRAEGDVYFECSQIAEIKKFVGDVILSGERMNYPVSVKAYVPSISKEEVIAQFTLTLSLKLKN